MIAEDNVKQDMITVVSGQNESRMHSLNSTLEMAIQQLSNGVQS